MNITRLLLAAGADATKRDADGTTPLHMAVIYSGVGVVQMLLLAGADILMRHPIKVRRYMAPPALVPRVPSSISCTMAWNQ